MLGGFTLLSVMAFHIGSIGTSDSDQGTVNSGESQRTIDDGSSYRAMRLSSLEYGIFNEDIAAAALKKGGPTSQDYNHYHPAVPCSTVCIILEWRRRRPTFAVSVTFTVYLQANNETDSANSELELPSGAIELVSKSFYIV